MTCLRLWIDRDWPEKHTDLAWWLFDDRGIVIEEGRCDARHWPGVRNNNETTPRQACELILAGDQGATFSASLPAGKAGKRPEVIAYALEEQLLEPPENYHLQPLSKASADGNTRIAAIPRKRLDQLLANLTPLGLEIRSIRLASQLLRPTNGITMALTTDGKAVFCTPLTNGTIDNIDPISPPWEIEHALAERASQTPELTVLAPSAQRINELQWLEPLGIPLHREIIEIGHSSPPHGKVQDNLCSGNYAPRSAPGLKALGEWRAVAIGLAVIIAIFIPLILGEWAWNVWQVQQLRAARDQFFTATWPQAGPAIAPMAQAKKQIDSTRRAQGLSGHGDFLPLLQALSVFPELRIGNTLRYTDNRLDAEIALPNRASLDSLQRTLSSKGMNLQIISVDTAASGLRAKISLQP